MISLASLTSSSTLQPSGSPRLLASSRAATFSSGVMTHPRPVLMIPTQGTALLMILYCTDIAAICYLQSVDYELTLKNVVLVCSNVY